MQDLQAGRPIRIPVAQAPLREARQPGFDRPAQGAAQRTVSQSIDATAAKALFLLLKFLRSPSLMLHADRARRPDTQVPSRRHGRGTRLEGDVSVLDEPRTELVLVDGAREGRR